MANAEKQLRSILDNDDKSSDAWVRLILLLEKEKKTDEASQAMKDALKNNANNPDLLLIQAMSVHEKGDLESAEDLYRKVIHLDPQNAQAHFNLGVLLDKKGKFDEAMEEMRKVMKIDPQNGEAFNYVGYSYADKNIRLDEAKDLVEKAVKLDPDNPFYLDSLGWVYYRRSDYPGAKAQLEKAEGYIKDGDKDNAVVYDHLGEVFIKLGDKESAVLQWKKAAELDPDNKDYPAKIAKAQPTP